MASLKKKFKHSYYNSVLANWQPRNSGAPQKGEPHSNIECVSLEMLVCSFSSEPEGFGHLQFALSTNYFFFTSPFPIQKLEKDNWAKSLRKWGFQGRRSHSNQDKSHFTPAKSLEWGNAISHLPAGEPNNCHWGLCRLGDVKQVVEQGLILVVDKQIKFIQDKQNWAAAGSVSWEKCAELAEQLQH